VGRREVGDDVLSARFPIGHGEHRECIRFGICLRLDGDFDLGGVATDFSAVSVEHVHLVSQFSRFTVGKSTDLPSAPQCAR
jgi:hypothetical protein